MHDAVPLPGVDAAPAPVAEPTATDAAARPAAETRWPDYPARAPPDTALAYRWQQGEARGRARLSWQVDGDRYRFTLQWVDGAAGADGPPAREWASEGALGAAGLAPRRLVQRTRGRDVRAVNFLPEDGLIRFSASTQAQPLAPATQDRWSWIAQLAAIAEAAEAAGAAPNAGWSAGQAVHLRVAGLRGELDVWTFTVQPGAGWPAGAPPPPVDPATLLHLVRTPARPFDLRAEVWLSPAHHHWPVGLRLQTPPGAWESALWADTAAPADSAAPADAIAPPADTAAPPAAGPAPAGRH